MPMSRISSAAVLALALMAGPLCAEPAAIVTLASAGDRVRTRNPDLAAARLDAVREYHLARVRHQTATGQR